MFKKLFRNYISPIDQFLARFDKEHPLSFSQEAKRKEIERIIELRDHNTTSNKSKKLEKDIWENF